MQKNDHMPFGLIFEEPLHNLPIKILPVYDDIEDISVFIDEQGNKMPYVEYCGSLCTRTETRIVGETSDSDEEPEGLRECNCYNMQGKIQLNSKLLHINSAIGTKTTTAVEMEQTDEDVDRNYIFPLLNTQTATKTFGEGSDDDDE